MAVPMETSQVGLADPTKLTEPREGMPSAHEDEMTNPHFQRLPWFRLNAGRFSLKMNPVVSGLAALAVWGFVTWAIADKDNAPDDMAKWKTWVTVNWSWLYIASQDVWIAVLIWIMCTKYRHLKLGKDHEKPEFSDVTWLALLFCCGVAVGLFYYSVAEPMWHYRGWGGARWIGEMNDNDKGEHALMVTWYHWGLHGWIPYTTVGALISIMAYRRDMPMTMRFCFYPLIGDRVYGWIGDVVDVLSIVCTLFGVCTSLGLGVMQINKGIVRLDRGMYRGVADHPEGRVGFEFNTDTQVAIIWCITAVATVSVVSGLKYGIKMISQYCFVLGMFLMLSVLFMGDTMYILNLIVSTFGYYIWYLPKISFHTDAFELLGPAPDGRGGDAGWMDAWTIFYWGWWISWAPFCGTFFARISRGRTLGEFIMGTLIVPSIYSFLWLGIFGAEGIRMDRKAEMEGLDCGDWSGDPSTIWSKETNAVRLWCLSTEDIFFEQLASYGGQGFGDFLSIVSITALIMYFVTSSDSGSFVIDIIAANGIPNPPMAQRVFWAFSEGAAATALLQGGGKLSLNALQTVSLVCGLPYTFILFWMCHALTIAIKEEAGDLAIDRPGFKSFLLTIDHHSKGIGPALTDITLAIFAPFLSMGRLAASLYGAQNKNPATAAAGVFWLLIIIFICLKAEEYNFMMLSAAVWMIFASAIAKLRIDTRAAIKSEKGDLITDYLVSLCFYFLALPQMEAELAMAGKSA